MFSSLILLALTVVPHVFGNLVQNPGFEMNGGADSTAITSWDNQGWVVRTGFNTYPYRGASAIAALDGNSAYEDVIQQTIATQGSTCYGVSFYANSGGQEDDYLFKFTFGPTSKDVTDSISQIFRTYNHLSYLLPGLGNDLLQFAASNALFENTLDEVSVTAVTNAIFTYENGAYSCTCSPGYVYNVNDNNDCTLVSTSAPGGSRRFKRKMLDFDGVPW